MTLWCSICRIRCVLILHSLWYVMPFRAS